ncbi:MAG: AmmeMemoRadiSam system protein A [Deltaproteobacteria bacterium]|nr:AmmeMemoRadiSam system protein A [Deltaproteobacteria bacterium]MBI3386755.1 AmmeMemoRadiSam system protein A [Deltaproteobacteria bacterium]
MTADERRTLLRLARDTINARFQSAPLPRIENPAAALQAPAGVFVSLHVGAELRGCVGTLSADRPLHEGVAHVALQAAFEDPRFVSVQLTELTLLDIEISRLTTPRPTTPAEIVTGHHGVCVMRGEQRAVFLPHVATQHGWDRDRLLDELCTKASLPADAWRQADCQLSCFEAEVFSEREELTR